MKSFFEFLREESEHSLGTIAHVSTGDMFNQRNHAVVKAHDGWRQIHDYAVHGSEPKGSLGPHIDVSKMNMHGILHPGIGKDGRIHNTLQLAALPEGSKIRQIAMGSVGDHEYHKLDGKWHNHATQEGPFENHHISPTFFKIHHI